MLTYTYGVEDDGDDVAVVSFCFVWRADKLGGDHSRLLTLCGSLEHIKAFPLVLLLCYFSLSYVVRMVGDLPGPLGWMNE